MDRGASKRYTAPARSEMSTRSPDTRGAWEVSDGV